MIAVDEAVGKIRAAARVRQDGDSGVVLIARTDAYGVAGGNLDEAIARANAYLAAGADMASIEAPATVGELRRAVAEVRGPLLYNQAGDSPRLSGDELRELGVAAVVLPGAMLRPAIYEMHRYATELRRRGAVADVDFDRQTRDHPLRDLHRFAGMDQVRAWEAEFIPGAGERYRGTRGYDPEAP